jgi:hypothetical protein
MGTEYKDCYREEAAQRVEGPVFNDRTRAGRYVRRWSTNLEQYKIQAVLEEMRSRLYVDNPGVNRRVADDPVYRPVGRWRVERVWLVPEGSNIPAGIYESLRYGYLQPPSVSASYPKPDSASDWSKLDAEARVFRVTDLPTAGKTAGLPYYIVVYPNVAQETVREFCEAIIPRGTLTNPTFDKQTQLTGSFKFSAVRNEEQEDGSSVVYGILLSTTAPDGMAVIMADNCGSKVTHTIFNGVLEPTVVPSGTSGIEYRIGGFSFDRESGLYSFTIEKIEEKTLTAGVVTEADDLDSTRSEQAFTGVRTGNLDHAGAAVPVWTAGVSPAGTTVEQSISKKGNCTTDVRQKKRVAKSWASALVTQALDLFYEVVSTLNRNQSSAAADPAEPSGGVTQDVRNQKNADSTYDTTVTEKTERPVLSSERRTTETTFDETVEVQDRHQTDAADDAGEPTGGAIKTVTTSKTPGALYNNNTVTRTVKAVAAYLVTKSVDLFRAETVTHDRGQVSALLDPVDPPVGTIETVHNELNEAGRYDRRKTTSTECAVSSVSRRTSKSIYKEVVSVDDRGQVSAASDAGVPANGEVKTVVVEKTPHGRHHNTTTTEKENAVSSARVTKRKTTFEDVVITENKGQLAPATDPSAAGQTVTNVKTDAGQYDQSTETTTPVEVSDAVKETSSTLEAIESRSTTRNAAAASTPVTTVPSGGIIRQVASTKTPDGKVDNTERTIEEKAVGDAVKSNEVTAFGTRVSTLNKNQPAGTSLTASLVAGVLTTKTGRKTPGGLLDVEVGVEEPTASQAQFTITDRDGQEVITLFHNKTKAQVDALVAAMSVDDQNALSAALNKYDLYDGRTNQRAAPGGSGGFYWADGSDRVIYRDTAEHYDSSASPGARRWFLRDTITYRTRRGSHVPSGLAAHAGGLDTAPSTFNMDLQHNTYYCVRVVKVERQKYTIPDNGGDWSAVGSATIVFEATNRPWGNS